MGERKLKFGLVLIAVLSMILAGSAFAKEKFPIRPINIVIPWAASGGGTLNTQALQPQLEKTLGQGAIITNKTGGGGTIAWNYVANSPPDGYTVGIVNPSLVVTQYTTKTGVSYDRFDPIIVTTIIPAGIIVRADAPWKNFKEFIDYAKANPGKVQMANSGPAAMYDIAIVGIEMATGAKFTQIPYKGSGPCVTALLGGHVDGSVIDIALCLPYVEGKKFRVLAVSSSQRSSALQDVPTFKECGFELDVGTWFGYVVPKGTPKDRIKILHGAFKAAMDSEEFKSFYTKQKLGDVVAYMNSEGLGDYLNKQDKLWKKIIDFGGYKPIE